MVMVAENQPKTSCCSVKFPYMAAESKVPVKKFKITTKQVRNASEDNSCEKTMKDIVDNGYRNRIIGGVNKCLGVNTLVKGSMAVNSGKRKPEMSVDGQRGKMQKQKMEPNLKLQLSKILKELISHRVGWIFSEPVDPVKLQVPDYFSIITKPMDLGTILHRLEENMYSGADEFAADVRLTFANAMSYNPPGNEVHQFAKTLDAAFSRKWRLLEAKLKHGKNNDEDARFIDHTGSYGYETKKIGENNHQNMKLIGLNRAPFLVKHGTSKLMSLEEKQKFRLQLVQVISRKVTGKLQTLFQTFGLAGLDKERLDSYIDSTDDETLWKLRREVKVLLGANDGKVKAGKITINGCSSLSRAIGKEHCSHNDVAYAVPTNQRQPVDSARLRNGAAQRCASDISSERSAEHNHCDGSKLECEEFRYPLESSTSNSSLDTDGPGAVVNEASSPRLSTPACIEGWTYNVPVSPKKALRAAMLKKRFADMIFKATHQELLDHSDKPDPLRMQQARERLEREQQEEEARIEAQIKAAEKSSQRRKQEDLKMRRERERKAARMAMEKMERSVEINENVGICKGLEMIDCGYLYYPMDGNGMGCDGIHHGNPLEQLSLYLKDDFSEEDEDAILNREEGEILL